MQIDPLSVDKDILQLFENLKLFEKMYEIMRIVDPIKKQVLTYCNNTLYQGSTSCFDLWSEKKVCDNCVSIRAFYENDIFIKIEYLQNKIYMITAIPIIIQGSRVVLELIKDVTNSMVFEDSSKDINAEVNNIFDRVNSLAVKDGLTGIFNRRYINERLPADLISSSIGNHPISIIIADLDHFKNINDTYGHITGDNVLKEFAALLEGCIRKTNNGWVARYGGEEFLVCLPQTNMETASEIAEKMRYEIENKTFIYNDITFKITSSFGVCCCQDNYAITIDEFIDCADKKLYQAKNLGRNRVE